MWFTILLLALQNLPSLIEALKALIDAIKSRNSAKGVSAVTQGMDIAIQVVTNLAARSEMTNEQKRDQAAFDIQATAKAMGIELSDSDCRLLAELAYKRAKGS